MSSSAALGQYLWHELLTSDPDAGAGFYGKVLGWKKLPYEGEPGYGMFGNAQGPVGGVRVAGKDPLVDKVGPNWLTYVGVPDLDAALGTVQSQGGRVLHPVTAVPADGGRYAVIADPQGAIIGLYQPGGDMSGAVAASAPVVWHELTAENPEAALQFYKTLFGWEVVMTHDMGGHVGNYYLFGRGTTQMGGVFARPSNLPPGWPRWLVYLNVPSVTAAAEAAKAAGGKVLNPPHQVPGGNWIAQLVDAHGIPVAVHGPKEAAAAAPKAPAKPKAKAKVAPPAAKLKAKAPAKKKAKAKTQPKPKVKVKVKAKAKTKPKAKAKAKSSARSKVKAKAKGRAKSKSAPKAKRKAKKGPARKTARRGK